MDPLAKMMDFTEEKLGHSPHPPLVGVPIGAWLVTSIADLFSFGRRRSGLEETARFSQVVGLVGAAGAALTGLRDYSYIERDSPSHPIATRHGLYNLVVFSLHATSFAFRLGGARGSGAAIAKSLGFAGTGLMLYTGWLGGKLVEEYGEAVKPVIAAQHAAREQQRTPDIEISTH